MGGIMMWSIGAATVAITLAIIITTRRNGNTPPPVREQPDAAQDLQLDLAN
jgi:hypothetical protein